jgi:hydroxyquinol 1,2-dioxygenase
MTRHQTTDITQAVLDRLAPDADPRFEQILSAVIHHTHALAREVDLKPDEWMAAIQFLTRVGQTCDDKRQEFILLSDTLGLSMRVVQLGQARCSARAPADKSARLQPTEATLQGPFYWEGAPVLPLGSDIVFGRPGSRPTTAAASPIRTARPSPNAASLWGRAAAKARTTCRWAATRSGRVTST